MAKETIVKVIDDIDGSKGADEVNFSYQGIEYSIDLSRKNRAALEKALQPFIENGRKVPSESSRRRRPRTDRTHTRDLMAVRQWAKDQGIEVSDRGRIAQSVLHQYEAAHRSG